MLRSTTAIYGYKIHVLDGELGKVHDFFFDDEKWVIRYLVAETGSWLNKRKVLISTHSLGKPDWASFTFFVNLKKEQVENSPPVDIDKPVSRRYEEKLHSHFGWPVYWAGTLAPGPPPISPAYPPIKSREKKEPMTTDKFSDVQTPETPEEKTRIRSMKEVTGYYIGAKDGEIGHADDFIVNDDDWGIYYMVVDTRNWLPGRKVLVSRSWIEDIIWQDRKIFVDLRRDAIKKSPEFNPSEPVNREYEARLYDYYGRPKYWQE